MLLFHKGLLAWLTVLFLPSATVFAEMIKCNDIPMYYNPEESMCCDFKVISHQQGRYGCFQNEVVYDKNVEEACGSKLLDRNSEMKCSWNQQPYNSTESLDCRGNIIQRAVPKTDEDLTCCWDQAFDASVNVCCNLGDVYEPLSPEECCQRRFTGNVTDSLTSNLQCCGPVPFDEETDICCFGELYADGGSVNCGPDPSTPTYDPRVQLEITNLDGSVALVMIADGKLLPCDLEPYNPFTSACFFYQVFQIGSASGGLCGNIPYNRENASCCRGQLSPGIPEIPGITECAGTTAFLNSQKKVCQGKLHTLSVESGNQECCGTDLFDPETRLCCSDEIQVKTSLVMDCCHKKAYNPFKKTCARFTQEDGSQAYRIVDGVHKPEDLCAGEVLGDNEFCKREFLFPDRIIRGGEGEDQICEDQPYNSKLFHCSRDGRYLIPRQQGEGICYTHDGYRVYDNKTKICCYFQLEDRISESGAERRCCGFSTYIPKYQSCHPSTKTVVNIPERFSSRCHYHMFDTRTQVCDEVNALVTSIEEFEELPDVCYLRSGGFTRFNQGSHSCCQGTLWSHEGLAVPECCHDILYNRGSSKQICCAGKLHDTHGLQMKCDGDIAYVPNEQIVCEGRLHNITDGELCCGGGLFQPREELCCASVKVPKSVETLQCCGSTTFDSQDSSKICCGGKTLHDNIPGHSCCGTTLMKEQDSICVADKFVLSKDHADATCNPDGADNSTGTCCNGILHIGKSGSCDGVTLLDPRQDPLWCQNRLINDGEGCCSGVIYSTLDHVCEGGKLLPTCNGEVYNPTSHQCCDNKIIETSSHLCCGGRVRKIKNGENSCCRRSAYNNQTSICCRGRTVRDLSEEGLDLDDCCTGKGQVYSLSRGRCEDAATTIPKISGCSVCPTATRRPRREVRQAACTATFQGFFRVTAVDSSSGVVSVRLSKLEVDCPHCDGDLLSKAALREVKKLVLPCQCPLVLNQKYLLLDSVVRDDDRFVLSEDAVILPRSQSKVVTTIHTEGTCS